MAATQRLFSPVVGLKSVVPHLPEAQSTSSLQHPPRGLPPVPISQMHVVVGEQTVLPGHPKPPATVIY